MDFNQFFKTPEEKAHYNRFFKDKEGEYLWCPHHDGMYCHFPSYSGYCIRPELLKMCKISGGKFKTYNDYCKEEEPIKAAIPEPQKRGLDKWVN